jgi:hypothetical protein
MRFAGSLLVLMSLTLGVSPAQVTFDGPKEAKIGQMVTVTMVKIEGKGLSTQLLKNGLTSTDGLMLKTLDDKPVFFLVPQEPATYTLIASTTNGEKSTISLHTVVIVGNIPPPKPPTPVVPDNSELTNRFAASLQQSPQYNPQNLVKLIEIIEEVGKGTYVDTASAHTILKATTNQFMAEETLRPLRAEIAKYLRETVGNDPTKIATHFKLVASALKNIK